MWMGHFFTINIIKNRYRFLLFTRYNCSGLSYIVKCWDFCIITVSNEGDWYSASGISPSSQVVSLGILTFSFENFSHCITQLFSSMSMLPEVLCSERFSTTEFSINISSGCITFLQCNCKYYLLNLHFANLDILVVNFPK